MNKQEINKLKEQAKAKAEILSKAHKSNPPKPKTKNMRKSMDTKALKKKPTSTDIISSIIGDVLDDISVNISELTKHMSALDKIDLIENLQAVRDTENFHELKWGK